jgi:hypothetical protein
MLDPGNLYDLNFKVEQKPALQCTTLWKGSETVWIGLGNNCQSVEKTWFTVNMLYFRY